MSEAVEVRVVIVGDGRDSAGGGVRNPSGGPSTGGSGGSAQIRPIESTSRPPVQPVTAAAPVQAPAATAAKPIVSTEQTAVAYAGSRRGPDTPPPSQALNRRQVFASTTATPQPVSASSTTARPRQGTNRVAGYFDATEGALARMEREAKAGAVDARYRELKGLPARDTEDRIRRGGPQYEAAKSRADEKMAGQQRQKQREAAREARAAEVAARQAEAQRSRSAKEAERQRLTAQRESQRTEKQASAKKAEMVQSSGRAVQSFAQAGIASAVGSPTAAGLSVANGASEVLSMAGAAPKAQLAAKAIIALGTAASETTKAFIARGKELAGYSGILSATNARADIRSTKADIREAQTLGPGIGKLTEASSHLEIAYREITLPIKEAMIETLIPLVESAVELLRPFAEFAKDKGSGIAEAFVAASGIKLIPPILDGMFGGILQLHEDNKKGEADDQNDQLDLFYSIGDFHGGSPFGPAGDPVQRAAKQHLNIPAFADKP